MSGVSSKWHWLVLCSVALSSATAEDWSFVNGKAFKDVRIESSDAAGVSIRYGSHDIGAKIPWNWFSPAEAERLRNRVENLQRDNFRRSMLARVAVQKRFRIVEQKAGGAVVVFLNSQDVPTDYAYIHAWQGGAHGQVITQTLYPFGNYRLKTPAWEGPIPAFTADLDEAGATIPENAQPAPTPPPKPVPHATALGNPKVQEVGRPQEVGNPHRSMR